MITANPHADAERMADYAEATAMSVEAEQAQQHDEVLCEIREAMLTGDSRAIVGHVAFNGRMTTATISEVISGHMHDQDDVLLQLLRAASRLEIATAASLAETLIAVVANRHADDVIERLDVCGEVMP